MQVLMRQHDYLEAKTTKFKSCFWESTIRKKIFLFFRNWTIISPMLIHSAPGKNSHCCLETMPDLWQNSIKIHKKCPISLPGRCRKCSLKLSMDRGFSLRCPWIVLFNNWRSYFSSCCQCFQ